MKYIEYINKTIMEKTGSTERLVLFGQNIAAGSHISGFTKNIRTGPGGLIINATNSENTLAGLGFGMMLDGVSSIFFMKQLDFLLLGIDQLVDTYNFIRRKEPAASFTIAAVNSDLGWHGLQSSFNNLGDMCSIARVPGFSVVGRAEADEVINAHLVSPGFRIIQVSQRLFGKEILDVPAVKINKDKTLFQYKDGGGATIVCFNLSFPYGLELYEKLRARGIDASLFSVTAATPIPWDEILKSVEKTRKLVVIDDSKSENLSCDNLLAEALQKCKPERAIALKREMKGNEWLFPNADTLEINYEKIAEELSR